MWQGSLYGRFEASAVFMVLLSLCDAEGVIDMTPEAIAGTTGWPLAFIQDGLAELIQPDRRSRTPHEEGRRIISLDAHRDWGWRITNYLFYRDQMRSIERREYLRKAKQRERAAKRMSTHVNVSTRVNPCQPIAEAEAEADKKDVRLSSPPRSLRKSSSLNSRGDSDDLKVAGESRNAARLEAIARTLAQAKTPAPTPKSPAGSRGPRRERTAADEPG